MKPVLFWKYADLAGQLLMLLPILYVLSPAQQDNAVVCYFTVGLWQSLSYAITAFTGAGPAAASRRFYGLLLNWLLGVFTICAGLYWTINALDWTGLPLLPDIARLCAGVMLVETTAMLFLMPITAVWYMVITFEELTILRAALHHRAEIRWKL